VRQLSRSELLCRSSARRWMAFANPAALAGAADMWDHTAMRKVASRQFSVVVERDSEGYYVASVPEIPGCHTQARSLDQLQKRIREAISLCLEVEKRKPADTEFVGLQRITV
jgi:predicted RNase H-like HicB family nuclease